MKRNGDKTGGDYEQEARLSTDGRLSAVTGEQGRERASLVSKENADRRSVGALERWPVEDHP